jgi:hypothetical protein
MEWIDMTKDRDQWRAPANTILNLRAPQNAGELPSGRTTGGPPRRAQLRKQVCFHYQNSLIGLPAFECFHSISVFYIFLLGCHYSNSCVRLQSFEWRTQTRIRMIGSSVTWSHNLFMSAPRNIFCLNVNYVGSIADIDSSSRQRRLFNGDFSVAFLRFFHWDDVCERWIGKDVKGNGQCIFKRIFLALP